MREVLTTSESILSASVDAASNRVPEELSKLHAKAQALLNGVEKELMKLRAQNMDPDSRVSMEKQEMKLYQISVEFGILTEARQNLQTAVKILSFALRTLEVEG